MNITSAKAPTIKALPRRGNKGITADGVRCVRAVKETSVPIGTVYPSPMHYLSALLHNSTVYSHTSSEVTLLQPHRGFMRLAMLSLEPVRRAALFAMMLLFPLAIAAENIAVKGQVVSDDGKPAAYAYINVEGKPYATQADKDGRFSLSLPKGRYTLTAELLGYKADSREIDVNGAAKSLTLTLREDLIDLASVTVTGTRTPKALANTPVVTRIITADDIEKIDATNIKDVLITELPGLEFSYSMNQQVSLTMQGMGGMALLFLVDGERLAGETLDNTDFLRLNTDDIERIEIVKGAASALYGSNSVGAVINIITKKATDAWSLNLNSHYGSRYNEQRHGGTLGLKGGRWNSMLNVQTNGTGSFTLNGSDDSSTSDDISVYGNRQWNFKEKLSYEFNDKTSLTGRAGYYFHERNSSAVQKDRARDFSSSLRFVSELSERDKLEASYVFDRYDKSDFYTSISKDFLDYKNVQNSLRLLYTHTFSLKNGMELAWTSGGDGMIDFLKSYQFENDGDHQQTTADLFTQGELTINKHWTAIYGLRADYFSLSGWNLSQKAAAMFRTGKLSLRGSYSQGFRAPTLKEMYMNFNMGNIFNIYGNRDLKAEHSHTFTLSAEYAYKRYSLTASGYYNIMNDEITTLWNKALSDRKGAMEYHNIDGRNLLGADITLMARYPCGIGARVSYAYFHEYPRGDEPNTSDSRPHSLTAKVDYRKTLKNYEFDVVLTGRWLSHADYYTLNSTYDGYEPTSSSAYTVWNLSFSQRIYRAFRLVLSVNNLFNYKPSAYAYNSPVTMGTSFAATLGIDVEQLFKKK